MNVFIVLNLKKQISSYFSSNDVRTATIKKNIVGSFLLKCVSILVSLQVVPLTIDYINPTRYGIWLTLSSIIAWLSYFDLGFAHGFRNRFAEAKALGDIKLAKEYVSTTYAVLFLLFSVIYLVSIIINQYLDWGSILNIDSSYNEELHLVFGILACFFCLNIVASIFTTMLTADQKPALASLVQTGGQVLAFISIYILTKTTSGNLTYLAFAFSGIPCFVLMIVSIIMFLSKEYRNVAPSFKSIRFVLTKKILGLGGQFFFVMISMLFIFQFLNIIISRIEGPEAVTQYNIAYKYFNVANMLIVIVLTPFWSAFTDAYVKKDYEWMQQMVRKLESVLMLFIPLLLIMLLSSNFLYRWWIGDSINIPLSISVSVACYFLFQISGTVYMYLINGTSKLRLQLLIYFFSALFAIPLITFFCKKYGISGALLFPTVVFAFQTVMSKIQINKIVSNRAKGLWNK